ncbi:MAG: DUF1365 domain-containing protein [Pseudomonadota bacterium]|nr:DUF1365 domain-containing protein [Pseudomonadota bacterium]
MTDFNSSLYKALIFHRRKRPKKHKLNYGAFFLLLDLDELELAHNKLRFFSYNSFNLISFYDSDHGSGDKTSLSNWLKGYLDEAGVNLNNGCIKILTFPRIFGYVFNPITVYYCYHSDGSLKAVMYEVSNTFSQRHSYLFSINGKPKDIFTHSCEKSFYVSPFIEVNGNYDFTVKSPSNKLYLHIRQSDEDGPLLDAWFNGEKQLLNDVNLLIYLFRYPLLTFKVILGIHWEALILLLKGISLVKRPDPPDDDVTIVTTNK